MNHGKRNEFFKKSLINYYMKEGKKDFVLRLRGPVNDPEIKCYYQGIQVFSYDTGGKFDLNEAVFLPNNQNDKVNKNRIKRGVENVQIPKKAYGRHERIMDFGFSLHIKPTIILPFSKQLSYEIETVNTTRILERNLKKIEKLLTKIGIVLSSWKEKYDRRNKENPIGYEAKIVNISQLDYEQIYKLLLLKYSWNGALEKIESKAGKNFTGFCSLRVSIRYNLEDADLLLERISEFNQIMKKAIEVYALVPKKLDQDDFTNTRIDSEKAYQQKLMNLMGNIETKEKLLSKNSPFDLEDIPFEMEYYIYPSNVYKLESSKKKNRIRNGDNRKGRLDNIIINSKRKELKLIEIKIGEDVIGGTNGIHKHLLDLTNAITKNPKLIEEILEYAKMRRDILKECKISPDFEVPNCFQKIDYYIICGYTNDKSKLAVESRLKMLENRTILSEEVYFSKIDCQKSSRKGYEGFKRNLQKRTPKNPANEYPLDLLNRKIGDYCEILEGGNEAQGIPPINVKILLADQNFQNFEERTTGFRKQG